MGFLFLFNINTVFEEFIQYFETSFETCARSLVAEIQPQTKTKKTFSLTSTNTFISLDFSIQEILENTSSQKKL